MLDHRDTETQRINEVTQKIIGAAINVHRELGPGLLESAYEGCLCFELSDAGLPCRRQVELAIAYKNVKLDCGYRMDIVVSDLVVVELKPVGLLLNFHVSILKNGIKRLRN